MRRYSHALSGRASVVTGPQRQRAERDRLKGAPPYESGTPRRCCFALGQRRSSVPALLLFDVCETGAGGDRVPADGSLSSGAAMWVTAISALALARSSE